MTKDEAIKAVRGTASELGYRFSIQPRPARSIYRGLFYARWWGDKGHLWVKAEWESAVVAVDAAAKLAAALGAKGVAVSYQEDTAVMIVSSLG